jgi:Cu(I)/Ag(I) efflux system membrane fusion protein
MLPGVLEANGQIAFDERKVATIISRVNGRIEQLRVLQWDSVHAGAPIVELFSPDFMTAEAEYLQAKTTARLSAATALGGENLAAGMVTAARRKLELLGMSDGDIAAIAQPSPNVWMRAPIGGTITEAKATRGAQVNAGDVLFTVGTLDPIWVVADIYEDDLARVHEGQQLEATTTAYPDEVFQGVISRISPDIDPQTHTLQIRCDIRNPEHRLKPQMLARVKILTRPGEALILPQQALIFDTNQYYVFVALGDGKFERRAVTTESWREGGYVRVLHGVSAGERVVAGESIQVSSLWHQANGESY